MQCPTCKTVSLVMSERQGIEIDYCPQCRGVWLDRGELDKIIDRSLDGAVVQQVQPAAPPRPLPSHPAHGHQDGYHSKKRKREGFLSDIFDFD
ncbi:MAG: zf-TFIIB domain-containing protein [Hylemonella sp.]|nr:zf-TFIIB domain-containing protein [Hylemonella sp.]